MVQQHLSGSLIIQHCHEFKFDYISKPQGLIQQFLDIVQLKQGCLSIDMRLSAKLLAQKKKIHS